MKSDAWPGVWTVFTCVPCRATTARGGIWGEMRCFYCYRPMERSEHRPEKAS